MHLSDRVFESSLSMLQIYTSFEDSIQLVGKLYPDNGDAWRPLLLSGEFQVQRNALHAVSSLCRRRLKQEGVSLPSSQNPALSRKLEEQLMDTMAVAAVALPSW